MAKRKLLTLEDLYQYLSSSGQSIKFDSAKDDENIVVHINGFINFEKQEDKNKEGLLPVVLQSCHTLGNLNGSYITEETMTDALPSFSNRPILGYIYEVDGQPEFCGHNAHLDENDNIVYDEIPVGIIPESCDAKLVYDEEKKKTYVVVKGYIFEEYSKAAEILQREGECAVSVELSVRKLSYDAANKVLMIEDFFFSGVTILGKREDGTPVEPGMAGANIQLADFSTKNNSFLPDQNALLIETLERLNQTLSNFSINDHSKEGGNDLVKFDELLKQYNKTAEDITFDYKNMSDDELEAAFKEAFGQTDEDPSNDDGESEEVHDTQEVQTEKMSKDADAGSEESESDETDNSDEPDGSEESQPETYQKTFEISHEDIRYALYQLLVTYEETDNEWYYITDVYDTHFVYENWEGNKIYGQAYAKDNDVVAFSGERYNLHKELLTDSEYAELQNIRSNYSVIENELNQYKAAEEKANKDALFVSADYSSIAESDEFKQLSENHDDYSLDELKSKLDGILLDYAKAGKLAFSAEADAGSDNKVPKKQLSTTQKKKKGPYGTLSFK